jgi:ferredoxin
MRVHVDPDLCIGYGICEGDAPDVFSLVSSSIAEVIMDPVEPEFEANARMAAEDCPESAISIENGEESDTPTAPGADSADDAEESITDNDLERKNVMRATVDQDLCIGCGICEGIVPEVFSLQNEPYAEVLLDPIPEEFQDAVREAAEECSETAILIEE